MNIINFIIKNKMLVSISVIFIIILIVVYFTVSKKEVISISNENEVIEKISNDNKDYIKVFVTGEINQSKIIEVEKGTILNEIIKLCEGLTDNASTNINLVYEINQNVTLVIKSKNSIEGIQIIKDIGDVTEITEENGIIKGEVNINTANYDELCLLPGIGKSIALAIIEYRNKHGLFKSIKEITDVPGIKEAKYNSIKKLIIIN